MIGVISIYGVGGRLTCRLKAPFLSRAEAGYLKKALKLSEDLLGLDETGGLLPPAWKLFEGHEREAHAYAAVAVGAGVTWASHHLFASMASSACCCDHLMP